MNKTTKYVLVGLGVLALLGIGLAASARSKRKREAELSNLGQVPLGDVSAIPTTPQTTGEAILAVSDKVLGSLSGTPEAQQQRLANRRLRQSTRQAKLLKKGKVRIEDLQALQKV